MASSDCTKSAMKWTDDHDSVFVREIFAFTPWIHKRGSPERGEIWGRIADSLNSFESPQFRVTQRAVRDRYTLLEKKHKKKVQEEERASGISPEESQVDIALEDIISQFREADLEHDRISGEKKAKQEAEVSKAEEMRKMALETFKETQKRNDSGDEQSTTPRKKKRASGSDAIGFLKEKTEMEVKLKAEEMELKRQEFESRKQEKKEKEVQMQQMQQMQQQQLQLLLKQQEQQSAMMMALLEKFLNKP